MNANDVQVIFSASRKHLNTIGTNGFATMQELEKRSGCQISINKQHADAEADTGGALEEHCEVCIKGATREHIERAKHMLNEIIQMRINRAFVYSGEKVRPREHQDQHEKDPSCSSSSSSSSGSINAKNKRNSRSRSKSNNQVNAINGNDTIQQHPSNNTSSHQSSFQRMVEKSPSYINVTLSTTATATATFAATVRAGNDTDSSATASAPGVQQQQTKRNKLRREWEETCLKWGFVVLRQLTFVQNTFLDIMPSANSERGHAAAVPSLSFKKEEEEEGKYPSSDLKSQSTIVVNGCPATKEKDELIVSCIQHGSPAHEGGMMKGDIIDSVYGMKDPTLSLLFGIMRDSARFVVKIKRMESSFERDFREEKIDDANCVPLASASTSASPEMCDQQFDDGNGRLEANRDLDLQKNLVQPSDGDGQDLSGASRDEDSVGDDMVMAMVAMATVMEKKNTAGGNPTTDSSEVGRTRIDILQSNHKSSDKGVVNTEKVTEKKTHPTTSASLSCVGAASTSTSSDDGKKKYSTTLGTGNDIVLGSRVLEAYSLENVLMPVIKCAGTQRVIDHDKRNHGRIGKPTSVDRADAPIEKNVEKNVNASDGVRMAEEAPSLDQPDVQEEMILQEQDVLHYSFLSVGVEIASFDQPDRELPKDSQPQAECGRSTCDNDEQIRKEPLLDSPSSVQKRNKSKNRDERRAEDDVHKEENLLTALIEKSIISELDKGGSAPSRQKKSKSKAKKRKLSEDSISSKQEKVAKSKRKKERRQSEDEHAKRDAKQNEKSKKKRKKDRKASEDLTKSKKTIDESLSNTDKDIATSRDNRNKASTSSDTNNSGRPPRAATSEKEGHEGVLKNVQMFEAQKRERKVSDDDGRRRRKGAEAEVESRRKDPEQVSKANEIPARTRKYSITSIDSGVDSDSQSKVRRPSPLTIPRASPITISRQHSKVTVSSTSSKAGMGAVKSAKLKRLWPDSSVFSKRILKWSPPKVVMEDFKVRFKGSVKSSSKSKLPVIPSNFRDTSELIKYISPHILEEGIHSVKQEFMANSDRNGLWSRDLFAMHLRVSH